MTARALPALFAAVCIAGWGEATGAERVPEPPGYRTEGYRAPVPDTLAGATVVDTAGARALWTAGAVFVDALPRPPRPDLPEGTLWRPAPRRNVPGSIWLANTGYGELAPAVLRYFESALARATDGERSRPVVFYCLADCWMSWNAAKRAVALGYTAVNWYPEGTDGWAAAGLPLEEAEPEPDGREIGGGTTPGPGRPQTRVTP